MRAPRGDRRYRAGVGKKTDAAAGAFLKTATIHLREMELKDERRRGAELKSAPVCRPLGLYVRLEIGTLSPRNSRISYRAPATHTSGFLVYVCVCGYLVGEKARAASSGDPEKRQKPREVETERGETGRGTAAVKRILFKSARCPG